MPVFWRSRWGTTSSIWDWSKTVVSGIQRKLLPNQKALSAAWRRLPKCGSDTAGVAAGTAVITAQGYC